MSAVQPKDPSAPPAADNPGGGYGYPASTADAPQQYGGVPPQGYMGPPQPGFYPQDPYGYQMGPGMVKGVVIAAGPDYTSPNEPPPTYGGVEEGGEAQENHEFAKFTQKSIRLGFIKRVFGLLAVQLLVTGAIMCMFMYWKALAYYSRRNSWMYITAMCITFAMIIVLGCVNDLRRKVPINIFCLLIFTLAMSWMLGTIASYYEANEVLMAVGIVCVITIVMSILGIQQRFDFTWLLGFCSIACVVLVCYGLLCAIIRDRYAYMAYAAIGSALLLCGSW